MRVQLWKKLNTQIDSQCFKLLKSQFSTVQAIDIQYVFAFTDAGAHFVDNELFEQVNIFIVCVLLADRVCGHLKYYFNFHVCLSIRNVT